jgi:hypothetical protein
MRTFLGPGSDTTPLCTLTALLGISRISSVREPNRRGEWTSRQRKSCSGAKRVRGPGWFFEPQLRLPNLSWGLQSNTHTTAASSGA